MRELDVILLSLAIASVGTCIACFSQSRDVAVKNVKLLEAGMKWMAKAACLESENAKLRDVIESEIHCWKGSCNGCVAYRPTEDGWCDQQSWLEELGIEGEL